MPEKSEKEEKKEKPSKPVKVEKAKPNKPNKPDKPSKSVKGVVKVKGLTSKFVYTSKGIIKPMGEGSCTVAESRTYNKYIEVI